MRLPDGPSPVCTFLLGGQLPGSEGRSGGQLPGSEGRSGMGETSVEALPIRNYDSLSCESQERDI